VKNNVIVSKKSPMKEVYGHCLLLTRIIGTKTKIVVTTPGSVIGISSDYFDI